MDKSRYIVSIIVPVYNAEKYLNQTISSVRNQTVGFDKIQLILVDDCSKDGSFALITKWAEKFSNVLVLKTPAGSGSASMPRNIGLDSADADYIMFLDADDALQPDAVKTLLDIMTQKGVDLADAAFAELGSKEAAEKRYINCREGLYEFGQDADEWFPISHPIFTKMFKREIIEKNNIRFNESLRNGEDSIFLYSYMASAKDAWHVNKTIYNYRVHGDSVSHNINERYFLGLIDACKEAEKLFFGTGAERLARRFVEEIAVTSIDLLCDAKDMSDDTCRSILKNWYPVFLGFAKEPYGVGVAVGDIMARDAAREDTESFEQDFFAMRKLYKERADFVGSIFASRGWKLITFINKLLRRG